MTRKKHMDVVDKWRFYKRLHSKCIDLIAGVCYIEIYRKMYVLSRKYAEIHTSTIHLTKEVKTQSN